MEELKPVKGECWGCGKDIMMVPFGVGWEEHDKGELLIDVNQRYCPKCLDKRLKNLERARDYMTDVPPDWFDPTYAGERWDDDY